MNVMSHYSQRDLCLLLSQITLLRNEINHTDHTVLSSISSHTQLFCAATTFETIFSEKAREVLCFQNFNCIKIHDPEMLHGDF